MNPTAGGKQVIEAEIPQSCLFGYCTDLRSMTEPPARAAQSGHPKRRNPRFPGIPPFLSSLADGRAFLLSCVRVAERRHAHCAKGTRYGGGSIRRRRLWRHLTTTMRWNRNGRRSGTRRREGVPAHGVEHVIALHPALPGHDVQGGVGSGMAYVEPLSRGNGPSGSS